ncbi:tail assembly protein [Synergistes jonesii]|uniref:Tail protein n=1 Tax=Synergistes jonesii TaxID=2754 RepID=A0A073IQ23_9BACT|nr:tail assembly protein [Synergistes jonesii]KEJ91680.1 hypothetical protein EH55_06805 [Synergistes jonesii]MDY2985871.1 tail assembly protein [Synergistes jonesii]
MLRKVCLHGYLAEKFGEVFELDVQTPAEAVRALSVQLKGFASSVRGGEFFVLRDKEKLEEVELLMTMGGASELHIVPVANGSKNNGVLKVVLGVVLIGVSFAVAGWSMAGMSNVVFGSVTAGHMLAMGAGMLLNGLGQLLSPTPTIDSNESPDSRPSYLFSGAQNLEEEGNVIPLVYGAPWAGSLVASCGFDTQEVN